MTYSDLNLESLSNTNLDLNVRKLIDTLSLPLNEDFETLHDRYLYFWKRSKFSSDIYQPILSDLAHRKVPNSCPWNLSSADDSANEPRFEINQERWQELSVPNQSILIFHEILLTEYLLDGYQMSLKFLIVLKSCLHNFNGVNRGQFP